MTQGDDASNKYNKTRTHLSSLLLSAFIRGLVTGVFTRSKTLFRKQKQKKKVKNIASQQNITFENTKSVGTYTSQSRLHHRSSTTEHLS